MGTVPVLSLIGMGFAFIVAVGLPMGLMIYAFLKLKADMLWFGIGAATFIFFALVLEQCLHVVMVKQFGETLTGNLWLKAIYGGLAAGVFEEVGRFTSMNLFKKKELTKHNALMYGIGHGGIEAIIIVGLSSISNLITSIMINTGTFEPILASLDASTKEQTMQQVSLLWTTDSLDFYLAGVERVVAVTLHICLSYIVYKAVTNKKVQLLLLAIVLHAGLDFVTVLLAGYVSSLVLELVLIVLVTIIAILVHRAYSKEREMEYYVGENL
ncbi:YhfC family intramembrane metalloprotease [Pseudobutyrivibrio sp.]|uniref:YhfC family intramembrane metalloprotease n=1 Tax=Pseudobutyrivibrio sp. TaxID=2014367 RepID=UPI001B6B92BC|nr:YhfC family glutamic-type intramembrane protease [Pseudobutyrivibrio sp.]MBP3262776.1 YhfC family intramembrane metalloprotease [Pseudobutyrivibrio sp.]